MVGLCITGFTKTCCVLLAKVLSFWILDVVGWKFPNENRNHFIQRPAGCIKGPQKRAKI